MDICHAEDALEFLIVCNDRIDVPGHVPHQDVKDAVGQRRSWSGALSGHNRTRVTWYIHPRTCVKVLNQLDQEGRGIQLSQKTRELKQFNGILDWQSFLHKPFKNILDICRGQNAGDELPNEPVKCIGHSM